MSEPQPVDLSKNNEHALNGDNKKRGNFWLPVFFLAIIISIAWYGYRLTTPSVFFVPNTLIEIPEGASLSSISKILEQNSIIRSPLYFSILVTHLGKEKSIPSGVYLFNKPENIFTVAERFAKGDHGVETVKITLPEGLTIKEMSEILTKQLHGFDAEQFSALAKEREGYLFPDTYFFFTTATSGEVYAALAENFKKKTQALHASTTREGKDWAKIITMASIIEGEAVTPSDRRIISGILYARLKSGMRLGVDAPFVYIMGKGSLELTVTDLATSSPYNTYRNPGLPPTPINNPGLDAIEAALYPSSTPYLYYLSDKEGKMHYAKTFEEHKLNKAKYLR